MFCTKCGNPLPEDARFCIKCGFPVPKVLIQVHKDENQQESQTDKYIQEVTAADNENETLNEGSVPAVGIPPQDDHAEIKEFIGNNADYYLRKWGKSSTPGKAVSLNWASFFLTGYWLVYRKMYLNFLFWFLIILGLNIVTLIGGTDNISLTIFLDDLLVVCINVLMGLFGNALYYRHVEKKVKQWNNDPSLQAKKSLAKLGGTSWLSVVLLIVANVVIGIITFLFFAASIFNSGLIHDSGVTFGTGSDDYGVTGVQDHFSADSPIYLEATFGNPVGTDKLKVFIIKQDGSNEVIVDKWSQDIDPNWDSIYFNLYDPTKDSYLDPGHYVVRIYDGGDLLDEGEFDITTFSIDGGSNEMQF